jgi:hypothetical protein
MGVALGRGALVADELAAGRWCGRWRLGPRPSSPTTR